MKICKKCIQPDTRPGIWFNEDGVCGACVWEEQRQVMDWTPREKELQDIANWAKKTSKSDYDCVIGISGGKDSTKQALTARDKMGLRCLLVNGEPDGITNVGRHNVENLKNLGFDVMSLRPNPKILRKLMKYDFYKYLNPIKATEYALWSSAYIVADNFNIPLIIEGENVGLTLGVSKTAVGTGPDAITALDNDTISVPWKSYTEVEGVEVEDLFMYHADINKIKQKGIRGIYLQYFLKEWSFTANAEFSIKNGLKTRDKNTKFEDIGTYALFAQLDTDLNPPNQLLKYIKLGFGQCMDHACYDLRENRITREEAIELVRKYDGKCAQKYIEILCGVIGISIDEFWNVAEKFRGPMWQKENKEWHNTYWDIIK